MKYLTYIGAGNGSYPVGGCCAIANVRDFYEDSAIKYYTDRPGLYWFSTVEEWKAHTLADLKEAEASALKDNKSILFATVSDRQLLAEECLIEAGFTSTYDQWALRHPKSEYGVGVKMYSKIVYGFKRQEVA